MIEELQVVRVHIDPVIVTRFLSINNEPASLPGEGGIGIAGQQGLQDESGRTAALQDASRNHSRVEFRQVLECGFLCRSSCISNIDRKFRSEQGSSKLNGSAISEGLKNRTLKRCKRRAPMLQGSAERKNRAEWPVEDSV